MAATGTAALFGTQPNGGISGTIDTSLTNPKNFTVRNGFDLVWSQQQLAEQMSQVEQDIRKTEENSNLSDTEKMFAMQMSMNTWSAISNLRTNELKSISDTLKSIARNID